MKKLFLLPLTLLAILTLVVVSCEEKKNDDVCLAFEEITAINPSCEIPSVCCPVEVGNCYYVAPNGDEYKCDATLNSTENPDGCNDAMNEYIENHCETTKMDKATHNKLVLALSKFTQQMLIKARNYSVCY
ncbi:MAG: hypothetical protein RBR35_10720 [Salinivirgaceae bacterium]|nr:hypothetical protein [Salinivirgaceae bacterium]MDY0281020.1 hypothetical protein [Salinivirgaceae bacterium]